MDPATHLTGGASAIAVTDVHKTFRGGVQALRGVTLDVAPGEIFGLLGRKGAGKTTLVRILFDLVRPTRGAARLLGVSTRTPEARRAVGYVPEDPRFPDDPTGEGALRFCGRLAGLGGTTLRTRVRDVLGRLGLSDVARQRIRNLPRGMRQRFGLAQALLAEPRVLVLDEPTDGVDAAGRTLIRDVLDELQRQGRTVFLDSHVYSEVEQRCDRVALLDQGAVVRCGPRAGLTSVGARFVVSAAEPIPVALLAGIANPPSRVEATAEGLEVELADEAEIDALVDRLRAGGVRLRGLVRKRHTLEQAFLGSLPPVQKKGGAP